MAGGPWVLVITVSVLTRFVVVVAVVVVVVDVVVILVVLTRLVVVVVVLDELFARLLFRLFPPNKKSPFHLFTLSPIYPLTL